MKAMIQMLTVLGSTGSIGVNTLDVVSRHPDKFQIFALTGAKQVDVMLAQCAQFKPLFAVMVEESAANLLRDKLRAENLPTQVLSGASALVEVACDERVNTVMAAIVGAAGLPSCLSAAKSGKRLLLANKEALVVGGQLFLDAVKSGGAQLLPIDSEHSAVFQALPHDPSSWAQSVDKIILTASGGPFRSRDPLTLRDVTPEQACAHPNWVMGRKISVDSATMMNKALEVIEAKYLFGMAPDRIEVVIHPQSIVHSMVQFVDGSVVAQLGTPDMRVPIAYGLSWPQRMASGAANLDFRQLPAMSFESFEDHGHHERFPSLKLAWQALDAAPGTTTVLNAANEVAVAAFLDKQIRFDQIHLLNMAMLERVLPTAITGLEDLLELDQRSRWSAKQFISDLA
ncbi:MAG: 1-deoxy-D-xylulose 5-phosphate reductoisomerase [Pseudomonadota bacterium]